MAIEKKYCPTLEQFQNPREKSQNEAKSIFLAYMYMTDHFPGFSIKSEVLLEDWIDLSSHSLYWKDLRCSIFICLYFEDHS